MPISGLSLVFAVGADIIRQFSHAGGPACRTGRYYPPLRF